MSGEHTPKPDGDGDGDGDGRRSPRVTPSDAVEGRTLFDTSVRVIDLSAEGALVETSRGAVQGSQLRLDLDLGTGADVIARVLRVSSPANANGVFRLGLRFEDVTDEIRGKLEALVARGSKLERRQSPRIYVDHGARAHEEVELEVINLGLFGGLFGLDSPLEFESHHDFVFTLPQGDVRARGMVRHCEAWVGSKDGARFRLGVEFTELDGADRERVVAYIATLDRAGSGSGSGSG